MARYESSDEDVVVIVGSGAGGGTLAHELCRRGVPVVLLEAGPHLTHDDFVNDEWAAFTQMAWRDTRTTSGSWRIAIDFPGLPAWTCKIVGGTTTHWAGACPRFKEHEFRIRSQYGEMDDANLLDWPIGLEDLDPYYDQAEDKMGVTHTNGIPPLPANNNYKVFANGALRAGYTGIATGPYCTNSVPRDGRPATIQDGFNFQGDKNRSKWSTLVTEIPKAEATGRLDLRPLCQVVEITHDAAGRVDGAVCPGCSLPPPPRRAASTAPSTSTATGRRSASARGPSAWPRTRSRRRASCSTPPRPGSRTASPTRRDRSAGTTCAT